jgi:hypothetical protein
MGYGATPKDWARFRALAKEDLLPVVSNPNAVKSPRSKMKQIGKTPSLLIDTNEGPRVIGFTDWTDHRTTVGNIETWQKQPDYGICVQTRKIRGFDCDIPDDDVSDEVINRFCELIEDDHDKPMGLRFRKGTGKKLLAFIVEGNLEKRSFVVKEWQEWDEEKGKEVTKRWLVEFLADGQQFVAVGTHPDGSRYEWAGGIPKSLPTFSEARFDRAWRTLVREFAIDGKDRRSSRRDPTLPEELEVEDPVAEHLIETWETYGIHKGMLYLECPWKENHSSDNGETETAWMLAGTGRYRNGHFACRHAGCAEHTDADFKRAVGFKAAQADEFEDLREDDAVVEAYLRAAPEGPAKSRALRAELRAGEDRLPGFIRDASGNIESNLENVGRALASRRAVGCDLAFDEFRGELMIAEKPDQWRPLTDADAVRLRVTIEALGFKHEIGKEKMRDALTLAGDERVMDTAKYWLEHIVPRWDGVSRIHRFWPDYMQTKDTRYTRAMGRYSWTAQAARVLDPGSQVDMVPVLVGAEGLRKTSALKAIAPATDFYGEFRLDAKDEDLARIMRGKLVGELAELRGISIRDGEAVLAWITRTHEEWTPKFKEYATKLARRLVFYGTTNDAEFLKPHMGQRRWLPVVIQDVIDTDAIARDRLQLWAEARDSYLLEGICFEEAEELAKAERAAFRDVDPWHNQIERWLDEEIGTDKHGDAITPRTSGKLTVQQVLADCLSIDLARHKKQEQMRVGEVLKACGMERVQGWIGGRNSKIWVQRDGGRN